MKGLVSVLRSVGVYLATNKKARALEWSLLLGVVEAVRAGVGHA